MKIPVRFFFAAAALAVAFPVLALAQHGSGPEMKPLPVAETAPAVSFADGVKTDPALVAFFGDFAEALRTHDGKPFVPRLAENYHIDGFEAADMKAAFVKAMTMINPPEEIIITAIEPQADKTLLVKTGFKFAKRTAKREFTLSADHKLITTSLIAMRRVTSEQPARGH
ncbi:MAG: hypothetical protein C0518_02605 [Opitutus sp.]|nr:hypothetical protein [Opitutus sp.]